MQPLQILRAAQVSSVIGLPKSTLYLRIREGLLPKPINLGGVTQGWPAEEIQRVIAARVAGKSNEEIRELVTILEAERKNACSRFEGVVSNKARLANADNTH